MGNILDNQEKEIIIFSIQDDWFYQVFGEVPVPQGAHSN